MPIYHNQLPFGNGKDNQFEIHIDGEIIPESEVEQMIPKENSEFMKPITDEEEVELDFKEMMMASENEHRAADVSQFGLLKVLGQGSFGKVYMVIKLVGDDANKLYAMKVLKKATLKVRDRIRTKMERDILVSIQHPFIVGLHYSFQTEGKLYLILDLVRGGDLFGRLTREVMFTEEDAKFYLAELAMALSHLHSCGIIYRDLKPENILLEIDGHIKLTDFGLCKESVYDDGKTYSFCGTIEYMAPEVVTRKGHGPAADWWSFGVLMYEMLTGTLPFHASNRRDTMSQIINAKLGMPNMLSSGAQQMLRALFKRVPGNRLGNTSGLEEFKTQLFFKSIDFHKLFHKQLKAPFIPTVPKDDSVYIRQNNNKMIAESPAFNSGEKQLFKGFSYVAPFNENIISRQNDPNVEKSKNKDTLNGFLPVRKSNPRVDYDILNVIGEGSFSVVYKSVNRANKQPYAIKIIEKKKRDATEEIEVLLRYSEHPNIATLRDVYEDDERYYLILEYLKGGELLDRINSGKGFSEREVAYYMERICKIIDYLHEHNVVHRDLQPSNIMFCDDSYKVESIRLVDFGFAKQIRADNGLLMTPCFTANFVAPEVLMKQGYDQACDIWSLGVIMYAMLSSSTPFVNSSEEDPSVILKRISDGVIDMNTGIWENVSDDAKDLLHSMMNLDPQKRISASKILQHPWMLKKENLSNTRLKSQPLKIKNSMRAMFFAIQKSNDIKQLAHPNSSSLMQRRLQKKGKK